MATQPTDTSKPRLRTPGDELTVIAQRAQAFTNASGTAIALSEGNADEIICRARSGSAAPEVGTALRVEGSFTGLCIQSGKELRCDDAETDTRVDTAAIRALGIRSMVVTPIRDDNKVVGVLACFAPTAHAFTITHVAVLKTMADQISALLHKERRTREEGVQTPAPAAPSVPKPVASAPAPLPPPVVIKPAATASGASATAAARAPLPVSKVEPVRTEVAAPVPFPKKEEKQEKQKVEVKASFGTFDAVAGEEKKSSSSIKLIGIVAVAAIAAVSVFFVMKSRKPSTAVPVQHAQEAQLNTNTAPSSGQVTAPSAGQVSPSQPSTETTTNTAGKNSTPDSAAGRHTASTIADNARKPEKNEKPKPVEKAEAAQPPQEKPVPTPVALSSGTSRIAAAGNGGTQPAPDIAPSFAMASTNMPGALTALAKPVGGAAPAVAQSELEPIHVVKSIAPVYPPIARVRRLSGTVVVQGTVGKDGRMHNPKLISGPPIFRDAAFDAVKQWQFKPAKLNGQSIEQATQIKMDFKP